MRYLLKGTSRDFAGNVIKTATISAFLAGTTTPASIYTAYSGGIAVNTVTSDNNGDFSFYVDDGDYIATQRFKITIAKTGYTTSTYDYISIFDISAAIDTDANLAANSDSKVASQKATKSYADTKTTLVAVKADSDVADAISKKHSRSHAVDSTSDHSMGSVSSGYLVKSDGTKLANATNTDSDVSDAVTKKHTQGTDTTLGVMIADVNMNTHKLKNLSVPSTAGDSIRATAKITEALLESATDLKHTQGTDTGTTGNSFAVGDGTAGSNKKILAQNADANKPYLSYDEDTNSWVFSNDGSIETKMVGAGAVTFATAAEITTGTEPAKAIAPDQLKLSSPTFANITDSGLTASQMVCTDADKKLVSKAFATASEITTGTEAAKAIAPDQLAASHIGVPVGAEMLWPTETPPTGWMEEDGSSLVRTTYPALYAVIGTMYGAADATHFNLPDARGKFPRIWAHGQATDPDRATRTAPTAPGATISAGDHVGTNQSDTFKAHTHTGAATPAAQLDYGQGGNSPVNGTTTGSTGGNETRPVNTYRMMIIRAY